MLKKIVLEKIVLKKMMLRKILTRASGAALLLLCLASRARAAAWVTFPASWDVGQAFAVSITSDINYTDPTVTWLKRTVSLDVEAGGEGRVSYALLGSYVRDVRPGEYPILFEFTQGRQRFHVTGRITLLARKYPEEHLKVQPRMVTPDRKEQPRIKREAALVGAAKRRVTVMRRWTTPPHPPLGGNLTLTSHYGFRRVYNGRPRGQHGGADLRAPTGTQVLAPFAGTVVLTGHHYYAGKSVYIDSGNGVLTCFFHLDEIGVEEGDQIEKGQAVGKSGATGRVTGAHLHFGLCLAGQFVDPMPLLETSVARLLEKAQREKVTD